MPKMQIDALSGRASLAALALVALAVLAFLGLYRRAWAQGSSSSHIVTFAPIQIVPQTNGGGIEEVEADLFLPAVQDATTPFRLQAITNSGAVTVPIGQAGEESVNLFVFTYQDAQGNVDLQVYNNANGSYKTVQIGYVGQLVTIRILPAIRKNGEDALPISAGLSVSGFGFNSDFSTGPPFQYAMSPMP